MRIAIKISVLYISYSSLDGVIGSAVRPGTRLSEMARIKLRFIEAPDRRTSLVRVLLPGRLDACDQRESGKHEGADDNPMCRHMHQHGAISETADHNQIANDVDSE